MAGAVFDVYKLLVQDTAHISDRRQTMNNIYLSVNTLLLGALAVLVQQGRLTSFLFLTVEVFVSIAGFIIALQWRALIKTYKNLLRLRYETLEEIEKTIDIPDIAKIYTLEHKASDTNKKLYGYSDIEGRLPGIFQWLYGVGLVLLVFATFAARTGLFTLLEQHLPLPHFS
jgi:hypothetical protein